MNTEEFYRMKAIKHLREKKEMRFRKNMNLCFFVIAVLGIGSLVLYLIFK